MDNFTRGRYLSAKNALSGAQNYYNDTNTLRKKSRLFKTEYNRHNIVIYKGVPYVWDNSRKTFFMITANPETIACLEYANIPINVNKSLERICQEYRAENPLPEDISLKFRRLRKGK